MTRPDEVRGANGDAPKNATLGAVASSEGRGLGGGMDFATEQTGPIVDLCPIPGASATSANDPEFDGMKYGAGDLARDLAIELRPLTPEGRVYYFGCPICNRPEGACTGHLWQSAAASDASKAKENATIPAPAGDGVSDEDVREAWETFYALDESHSNAMRVVLEDFARRRQQSAGQRRSFEPVYQADALKLEGYEQGFDSACPSCGQRYRLPVQFANTTCNHCPGVALEPRSAAAAAKPQGQSTSLPATPPTPAIEDVSRES